MRVLGFHTVRIVGEIEEYQSNIAGCKWVIGLNAKFNRIHICLIESFSSNFKSDRWWECHSLKIASKSSFSLSRCDFTCFCAECSEFNQTSAWKVNPILSNELNKTKLSLDIGNNRRTIFYRIYFFIFISLFVETFKLK